jgi:hypothetical protein
MTALQILQLITQLLSAVAPIVAHLEPHAQVASHLPEDVKQQVSGLYAAVVEQS